MSGIVTPFSWISLAWLVFYTELHSRHVLEVHDAGAGEPEVPRQQREQLPVGEQRLQQGQSEGQQTELEKAEPSETAQQCFWILSVP